MAPKSSPLPLFAMFAAFAVACLVFGVINYRHEEAFFLTAEHATAHIVRYAPDRNPKVADFCPHYAFTTKLGKTVGYEGERCLSKPDPAKIGETEEVYFDPEVPEVVATRGWMGSERTGLVMGGAGFVFFLLIGLFNVWFTRRQQRRRA